MSVTAAQPGRLIVSRIAASFLGGYVFIWGVVSLVITLSVSLGAQYDDAQQTVMLIAFLLFLLVFIWSYAERSLFRIWSVLGGGGLLMTLLAWLVAGNLG